MSIYTNQPAEIATSVAVSNTAVIAPDAIHQLNGVQFSGTASLPTELDTYPLAAIRPTNLIHITNVGLGVSASQQPVFQPGPPSLIQVLNKPLDVLKTPSLPVDKFVRIDFGNARALSYPRISNDYFGYNNLNAGKSILGANITFPSQFPPTGSNVGGTTTYRVYDNPPRAAGNVDYSSQLPCLSGSAYPAAQGTHVAISGRTLGKPLPSNCQKLAPGTQIQNDLQFNNMSLLDENSASTRVGGTAGFVPQFVILAGVQLNGSIENFVGYQGSQMVTTTFTPPGLLIGDSLFQGRTVIGIWSDYDTPNPPDFYIYFNGPINPILDNIVGVRFELEGGGYLELLLASASSTGVTLGSNWQLVWNNPPGLTDANAWKVGKTYGVSIF